MATARDHFSDEDRRRIVDAIKEAELQTSGEIKLRVENKTVLPVMARIRYLFFKMGVHRTVQRNGVLIYIALKSRKFAILGDEGINTVIPSEFWASTKDVMQEHFARGEIVEGLIAGIHSAGQQLKEHFPYHKDDQDELSNEISFGDD